MAKRKIVSLFICIALIFGMLFGNTAPAYLNVRAADDYDDDIVFVPGDLGFGDGDFESASSTMPASPSGWTGAILGSSSRDTHTVKGVIDLTPTSFVTNYKKTYMLGDADQDVEYFNTAKQPKVLDADKPKVLMINNTKANAYGYSTSSFSVAANHYYVIKLSVMTCDFNNVPGTVSDNGGAYIRLNGDINFSTPVINTNFAWKEFQIVVSGHTFKTENVTMTLQVGDETVADKDTPYKGYKPTKGFAFFDEISSTEISYDTYSFLVESNKTIPSENLYFTESKKPETVNIPDFNGDFENGLDGWTVNTDLEMWGDIRNINTNDFSKERDKNNHLKANPHSTMGGIYALMFASNRNSENAYGTYKSKDITIKRLQYYRVSIWVNNHDLTTGSAFSRIVSDDENESINIETTSFSGGFGANSWNGNWQQASFYIKGSPYYDRTVQLEIGAGTASSPIIGAAYFDNVLIEKITASEYTGNSSNGTTVTFGGKSGSPNFDNGFFNDTGDYTDYEFPLPASGWTTAASGTGDYTVNEDNEYYVSGIIPVDTEHFDNNTNEYYGGVANPWPAYETKNVFMIWHKQPSATTHTSSTASVDADAYVKITLNLCTMMNQGSVTLKLSSSSNTLAVIENINTYGQFEPYSFYVKANSFAQSVAITLDFGEYTDLENKLGAGYVFIESVVKDTSNEQAFNNASVNSAKFAFGNEYFEAFKDTDGNLKESYTWRRIEGSNANLGAVVAGVADTKLNPTQSNGSVVADWENLRQGSLSRYAFVLSSTEPTAVGYAARLPIQFTASTHVKVTVRLKTSGFEKGTGARIIFDNLNYFENVNSEYPNYITEKMREDTVYKNTDSEEIKNINGFGGAEFVRYTGWLDYTFYVAVGESGFSDINMQIWLGNDDLINNHAAGTIVIDQITTDVIQSTEYNDIATLLAEDDNDENKVIPNYLHVVVFEASEDTSTDAHIDPDPDTSNVLGNDWYMLPSLLFGIVLILAILAFVIRALMPKLSAVFARSPRSVSYNREKKQPVADSKKIGVKTYTAADTAETEEETAGFAKFDEDNDIQEDDNLYADSDETDEMTEEAETAEAVSEPNEPAESLDEFEETKSAAPKVVKEPKQPKEKPEPMPVKEDKPFDSFDD